MLCDSDPAFGNLEWVTSEHRCYPTAYGKQHARGGRETIFLRVDGLFHQTLATADFPIITPTSFLQDKASPSLVAQSSLPI